MVAGISMGVLIGLVTGPVFLLVLRSADRLDTDDTGTLLTLTAELLAIPSFWFGGSWLSGALAAPIPPGTYGLALAATFTLFVVYPVARWTLRVGEDLGSRTLPASDAR